MKYVKTLNFNTNQYLFPRYLNQHIPYFMLEYHLESLIKDYILLQCVLVFQVHNFCTLISLSSLLALSYNIWDPWTSQMASASPWSAKNGNSMDSIRSSIFFTHSIQADPHLKV